MTHLIEHAAAYYKLSPIDIVGPLRFKHIMRARHVCCYVLRERFGMSLPLIGKTMHRDHSSVLYAVNKIRWSVQTDKTIAGAVDHLMQVPCTRFIPAALAA